MKWFRTIPSWLKRLIPALDWLAHYDRKNLPGDGLAGVIVATLLIPQAMGAARLGVLMNFLSHPVLSGFTSAAACHIALSQVKHLLGVPLPMTDHLYELLVELARAVPQTRWPTLAIGIASVLLLPWVLARWKTFPAAVAQSLSKSGPIVVVIVGTALVAALQLGELQGVSIIGEIPSGLPRFALPALAASEFLPLIPLAFTVNFIGYIENISIAKSLAAKRRQRVDANQEFIALGAANLAAGVTGGYPVDGSFSRSMVNYTADANTGLASLITMVLVGVAALFLMPLFHHLPHAVLAAIIIAVIGLIDVRMPLRLWRYNKAEAAALVLTFIAVLAVGVTKGILIGVAATITLYLWHTSRPHMAVVGRLAHTEFLDQIGHDHVFLSTQAAYEKLAAD